MIAIDTATRKLVAHVPVGQAPQAVAYVPNAVPDGDGASGLTPLATAGDAVHLALRPIGQTGDAASTSVSLFEQGLTQVLQAAVTGLDPKSPYLLALSDKADCRGALEPLATREAFKDGPEH